jgi:hypothetical protein
VLSKHVFAFKDLAYLATRRRDAWLHKAGSIEIHHAQSAKEFPSGLSIVKCYTPQLNPLHSKWCWLAGKVRTLWLDKRIRCELAGLEAMP